MQLCLTRPGLLVGTAQGLWLSAMLPRTLTPVAQQMRASETLKEASQFLIACLADIACVLMHFARVCVARNSGFVVVCFMGIACCFRKWHECIAMLFQEMGYRAELSVAR